MSILLRSASAQFASSNPPRAEPAEAYEVDSRVRKNRSCGGQILLQRGERVAIPGRGCVLGNLESARYLRESKLVPNLHHQHLALLVRQKIERGDQRPLRFVFNFESRLNCLIDIGNGSCFAPGAPAVAPQKIESNRANRRVKEAAVADVMLFSPEPNESFLDNVFGVGC